MRKFVQAAAEEAATLALPFELGAFLMGALRGWPGVRGKAVTEILNAKRFPMKPNRNM